MIEPNSDKNMSGEVVNTAYNDGYTQSLRSVYDICAVEIGCRGIGICILLAIELYYIKIKLTRMRPCN